MRNVFNETCPKTSPEMMYVLDDEAWTVRWPVAGKGFTTVARLENDCSEKVASNLRNRGRDARWFIVSASKRNSGKTTCGVC